MPARTVVITGASRGIGLATALRFAKLGYNVVPVARHEPELAEAARLIRATGATCEPFKADVEKPEEARYLIVRAAARFDRVDVLVNNAGVAPLAAIEEVTGELFEQVVAVNIRAIFLTTHQIWPFMREQGGGVIVNISSMASIDPFPGFAVYGASKAWVNIFSQAMAVEGKPHGIRVFAVAPGAVETKMLRDEFPNFPADKTLDPDAVAAVIESVCDERMAHASGQTIFVRK